MIRFRALGAPELRAPDGSELVSVLAAPKRLALFTYLALARPRGLQRRDRLVALFWPELDHEHARGALRQTLRLLRRAFGSALLDARGAEEVGLASDRWWCDAIAFEEALDKGHYEQALELYRGDLLEAVFVPDVSAEFEQWLEAERGRLRRLAGEAALAMSAQTEGAGALAAARHWAQRALRLLPFEEAALRQLLSVLDRAGERAEALATYQEFARRLAEELGSEPSPETAALISQVRQRDKPSDVDPAVPSGAKDPEAGAADAVVEAATVPPAHDDEGVVGARGVGGRPRRRAIPVAVGFATLLALGGAWMFGGRRIASGAESTVHVAVFPFEYRGSEALAYLGEGLVDLVSSRVDGVGDLRSVDPRRLLNHLSSEDGAPLDPDDSRAVAERFGADLYVLGSLVEAGGRLEAAVSVYDSQGHQQLATTLVAPGESSIFEFVDEVARQVIAARYGESDRRLAGRAAETTRSSAALKAYLEGERAFRAGAFNRAVEFFGDAVQQDTGFALAYYRLSVATEWAGDFLIGARPAAEEAMRRADRLPHRERRLLEASLAWRRGQGLEAERLYRYFVQQYPDDPAGWSQLGEVLFHYAPLLGRPLSEARAPFERVLQLEPGDVSARLHLARLAAVERAVVRLDSLAAREHRGDLREMRIILYRALARADTSEEARMLAQLSQTESQLLAIVQEVPAFSRNLAGAERVTRFATLPRHPPRSRSRGHLLTAYVALGRGHLETARLEFAEAEGLDSAHVLLHHAHAAALPFLAMSQEEIEAIRDALASKRGRTGPVVADFRYLELSLFPQLQRYLLGLLAVRLSDLGAATAHLRALEQLPPHETYAPLVQDLARGLRATIMWQEGRTAGALRILRGLNMELGYGGATYSPFFARTYERYLRAELLVALGRAGEALRWYRSLAELSPDGVMYLAPSELRRAEIYEQSGDDERAVEHYRHFVDLRDGSDPPWQAAVDRARRKLMHLERSRLH